jgi:hypothetical protein
MSALCAGAPGVAAGPLSQWEKAGVRETQSLDTPCPSHPNPLPQAEEIGAQTALASGDAHPLRGSGGPRRELVVPGERCGDCHRPALSMMAMWTAIAAEPLISSLVNEVRSCSMQSNVTGQNI